VFSILNYLSVRRQFFYSSVPAEVPQFMLPYENVKSHNKCSKCSIIGVNFYKAARLEPSPLFKLLGFRASEPPPHFFVTCNAYYEAVFCGLPNNKMTPNDIHTNQTTSFVRIQQWKLQAVSRIHYCVGIFQH